MLTCTCAVSLRRVALADGRLAGGTDMSSTASTSTSTSASTFDPPAGWDAARIDAETSGSNPLEQLADVVLSRILSRAGTRTVFGEPVVQGDITVVPVAKVSTRFG